MREDVPFPSLAEGKGPIMWPVKPYGTVAVIKDGSNIIDLT